MYLEITESHIPFWVTVTLTSDLVLRIIVFGAYLLYFFEVGIPNSMYICIFGWGNVTDYFQVTVTLTSDLVLIKLCQEHISYII